MCKLKPRWPIDEDHYPDCVTHDDLGRVLEGFCRDNERRRNLSDQEADRMRLATVILVCAVLVLLVLYFGG